MNGPTMPHLFTIGSTGRTGKRIIEEALSRGHTITALARNPESLSSFSKDQPNLQIVKGSPGSTSDLTAALAAAHGHAAGKPIVIISTLGQTRKTGNPWAATTSPPMFMTEAGKALFSSLASAPENMRASFQKIVLMSMMGAGDSFQNLHCMIKPVMSHSNMKQTIDDHSGLDQVVREQTQLKWVMVRPVMLKEGAQLPVKIHGEDGQGEGWLPSSVTVGSVVHFILDAAEGDEWDGKTPVLCN